MPLDPSTLTHATSQAPINRHSRRQRAGAALTENPFTTPSYAVSCVLTAVRCVQQMRPTSFVVSGFFIRSRQIGHISSLRRARGETATTVESVTIS